MPIYLFILSCLYFFLPAYLTNMAPPLAKKAGILKFLDKSVDFEKKYKEISLLGNHKTWRGVILGILTGMSAVWLQSCLYQFSFFREISLIDYREINIFLFGFLISFGASFGDLLFSFFKRRKKIAPGQKWIPFDQTDYIVGAFLLITPFFKLDIMVWLVIFILTFFLHIIVNRIGYELNLNKNKW